MAERAGLRTRAGLLPLAAALVGLALPACKKPSGTAAPDIQGWSLAEIEAELERTDEQLADAGIMVAVATPPVVTAQPESPPDTDDATAEPGLDGGDESPEPYPEIDDYDEPAPAPAAEPDYAERVEPEPAYAAERGPRRRRRASASRRRDAAPTRCERVCTLAETTCELEVQICELAEDHSDEPRYEQACLRAELQCDAASRACQRCED